MGKGIFEKMSKEEMESMGISIEDQDDMVEENTFESEIDITKEKDIQDIISDVEEIDKEINITNSLEDFKDKEETAEIEENEGTVEIEEIEENDNVEETEEIEDIEEFISNDKDLEDPVGEIKETADDILSEMEGKGVQVDVDSTDTIYDSTGKPVEFQVEGLMHIKEIPLEEIYLPPRTRKVKNSCTDDLESLIIQWGLIEPLHVIPFNGKYLLVHGFRRYQALKNLNYETAICLVDETRPKTTLRFLEVICNNSKSLDFFEIMNFGEFIEKKQKTFQNETIEKIIGMEAGDYLKAKYIRQYDNFGITGEVLLGKRTIKEGFKRLEKELDKLEKERVELMEEEINDQGLPESYLDAIEEEENIQDVKDRAPLPRHVYARIKARDKYTCQTCGIGYDQPELNSIHEVHHIIPVKQKGSDDDNNLILICSNCHKVVGSYINGEFRPPEGSEDLYKNMILLGNIARKGIEEGKSAYHFYMENCEQDWLN